jgi:hypothetical protein
MKTSWKYILCMMLMPLVLYAQNVVLVVSSKSNLNEIKESELKSFFMGRTTELKKQSFKPTLLSKQKLHQEFVENYLHETPRKFSQKWQKLIFTGRAIKPEVYESEEEFILALQGDSTLIGYILDTKLTEDIKVVVVKKGF